MTIFVPKLKEKGYLKDVVFTIAIVGSRKMRKEDDYGQGIWNTLAPNLVIYGFDADEDACILANENLQTQNINWQEKHYPLGLSDKEGEKTLYVTKGVDCSSLYSPDNEFLERFSGFQEHFKVDFSVEIDVTTIDAFCEQEKINNIDFLSLDIQGAELDVLKGATDLLNRSILGVELEVEFASMYHQQPLFADVDPFLRQYNFALFDLITDHPMCRRPRAISPVYSSQKIGQLLWADALYLRDPLLKSSPSFLRQPDQILKLACIADILSYPDYTVELLYYLTNQYGSNDKYNFNSLIKECLDKI